MPSICGETSLIALARHRMKKRETSFRGDILRLASGSCMAQVVALLAAPVLSRLYAPEAFGVAALFISITGTLGVVACLRYEQAIVVPRDDGEAANLFALSLAFPVLLSLLASLLIAWRGEALMRWMNVPELQPYVWLVPAMLLLQGMFLAMNYWNTRTKQFLRLAGAQFANSAAAHAGMLWAGFAKQANSGSMVVSHVGAQAVAAGLLGGQIWKESGRYLSNNVSPGKMWACLRRHRKYAGYGTGGAFLNACSIQLPTILLGIFFSPAVVGYYAVGHRLLKLPMSILGRSIGTVFYQRASAAKNEGRLPEVVLGTFRHLSLFSSYPFFALMLIGPELFSLVFGGAWETAGCYVQILAPWIYFVFLGSPISTLVNVLDIQETGMFFNGALVATRAGSLVAGGMLGNAVLALVLFSASGVALWAWFCFHLMRKSGVGGRRILSVVACQSAIGGASLIPIALAKWGLRFGPAGCLAMSAACMVLYYALSVFFDETLRKDIAELYARAVRKVGR